MNELQSITDEIIALYESSRAKLDVRLHGAVASPDAELEWCVAYVVGAQERSTAERLMREGFEVFLPCRIKRTHRGRGSQKRPVKVRRVLLSSYIFVGRRGQSFEDIRSIKGVAHLVQIDDAPLLIKASEIEKWAIDVHSGCFVEDEKGHLHRVKPGVDPEVMGGYKVGEIVRVAEGPFASFHGEIEEKDDARGLLKVLVNIFGRETPVTLEANQVEPLD